MNAPRRREYRADASVPVTRPKRSWLRRHWLTGALFLGLMVFATRTGTHLYQTELRLQEAVATRAALESQVEEARRHKENLEQQLRTQTTDEYREVMAKKMGFVYPSETVYQNGK